MWRSGGIWQILTCFYSLGKLSCVFQVHQNIFQLALESLYRITTNLLICNCKKLAYYLTALSQSQHSFTFSQSQHFFKLSQSQYFFTIFTNKLIFSTTSSHKVFRTYFVRGEVNHLYGELILCEVKWTIFTKKLFCVRSSEPFLQRTYFVWDQYR
jgi:hypothetical protein